MATIGTDSSIPFRAMANEGVEAERYQTLLRSLSLIPQSIKGCLVFDFGCQTGLSTCALVNSGADLVIGAEPNSDFVRNAKPQSPMIQISYEPKLPFPDHTFDTVLANAVLEHIPQPRDQHIAELWRVLRVGGVLIINETPNKYFPKEMHTTGLWFNHWLTKQLAYRRAIRRGRFAQERTDWDSSGWRGLGYLELTHAISGPHTVLPEHSSWRHRLLTGLGLPASILDPYPMWLLRKE